MFIADLLGGNEIKGFDKGIVIVNGEELPYSYYGLTQVCESIPPEEVSENWTLSQRENSFLESIHAFYNDKCDIDFVKNNKLMYRISFSTYTIDLETGTLKLDIRAYTADL